MDTGDSALTQVDNVGTLASQGLSIQHKFVSFPRGGGGGLGWVTLGLGLHHK